MVEYIDGYAIVNDGEFPDPELGPGDYPLAFGWILDAELMLTAYQEGIFAWSTNPVSWWSPDPRAIFELDQFHVSRSLARKIHRQPFRVTIDQAFLAVIDACSQPRKNEESTWINAEFVEAFDDLFRHGYAHSIECWQDDELVGGVFGVAIGGFFSAESMFHRTTDASKIALFYLINTLRQTGFRLLDIQVLTPHTESLGAITITRHQYLQRLRHALKQHPKSISPHTII